MGINQETIGYDGYGKITAYNSARKPELFVQLMQAGSRQEAVALRDHLRQLGHEIMIDVAASHEFQIVDTKTGKIMHSHPEGLSEWIVLREKPNVGIWAKEQ